MNIATRIGRAILWGQAGRLIEAGAFFFFTLLLARVLGPASYGLYALGMSLAGACGFVALLGLGPETLGRFLPELAARGAATRLLRPLLALRGGAIVAVASLLFVFRRGMAARLHFPFLASMILAVLLVFSARSIFDLLAYFSAGLLELRRVALAKFASAALAPAAFVCFLQMHSPSAIAAWTSVGAGLIVGAAILLVPLLRAMPGSAVDDVSDSLPLTRILAFGLFAWGTNFFIYILSDSTDVLLLGWLTGDRGAIGRYAAGARIVFSVTSLVVGWASLVSVAALSESYQRNGISGLARAMEAQWKLGAISLIMPLAFILHYARVLVRVLFSAPYSESAPVTRILCALMILAAVCGFSIPGGVLYALNRAPAACFAVGSAAAFNIAAEIVLVRRMGVEGAAWATGASFALLAIFCAALARRHVAFRIPFAFLTKVLAAALLSVSATLWLHPASIQDLAFAGVLYAVLFAGSCLFLKPLSASDSASLSRVNGRLGAWMGRFFAAPYATAGGD